VGQVAFHFCALVFDLPPFLFPPPAAAKKYLQEQSRQWRDCFVPKRRRRNQGNIRPPPRSSKAENKRKNFLCYFFKVKIFPFV